MNSWKIDKYNVATFLAVLFHVCGFIGMFTSRHDWFVSHTPLTLLVMFALIVWTQPGKNFSFFAFIFICFATGMLTEMIGVNTGLLFGRYEYGKVWGGQINHVPWLIGINWFTIIYCCGVIMSNVQEWFQQKLTAAGGVLSSRMQWASFILDGAMMATFFDFILEPVAVKSGYWTWVGSDVPFSNYVCWFLISAMLLSVFRLLKFGRHNQFAVHLLLIETLFFGALSTFL